MKLAFLGWANHVHLQRWAGYFAARHDVRVLNLGDTSGSVPGAHCRDLWTRNRGPRWKGREIRFRLRRFRPDVLHAHWAYFGHFARLSGIRPYGVTVWGSDLYAMESHEPDVQRDCVEGLREASFVTCDSEDQRRGLLEFGLPAERCHVVQWGVDTELFRPDVETAALRARLELGEGPVVFSPRQLAPVYRIDVVFEAFRQFRAEVPGAVLVQKFYNSDDAEVEELRKLAEKLGIDGAVRWVGRLEYEEMAALYAVSDLVVSVPRSDGTPMSLLEAMAAARPVVVSDLPSVREWIDEGEGGAVVPVGESEALSEALLRLWGDSDLRGKMGERNHRVCLERASQHAHMARMAEIYEAARHSR